MPITKDENKDGSPAATDGSSTIPSGFILKLFQMVNGAPDHLISWTPSGDAFIIGSDLNRLESETLPQYFRHNRFQSLVRQLNFYSFRKINRERNVWIYKHKLFHRDRPEDLHMVRRRTCPGVDGRKQRFSRFSAQSFNNSNNNNEDDDSSMASSVGDNEEVSGKKRRVVVEEQQGRSASSSKRSRGRLWQSPAPKTDVVLDTALLKKYSSGNVIGSSKGLVGDDIAADDSSADKKSDRMEQIERSMIVSEVASKLEEFARKALKSSGASRTRNGVTGVVTPPWNSSSKNKFVVSTDGLISYDDELARQGIVSDCEDSVGLPDEGVSLVEENLPEVLLVAPVSDCETVKRIVEDIRRASGLTTLSNEAMVQDCSFVAEFLMSTAPGDSAVECSQKIVHLLSSSHRLASDFHFYRAALHPDRATSNSAFEQHHAIALRHALECGSDQKDTFREFKIFAVNLIHMMIGTKGFSGIPNSLQAGHRSTLLQTAEAWSRSVEAVA